MQKIEEFKGEYGFLSNFHPYEMEWMKRTWKCSESIYQAMKDLHSDLDWFCTLDANQAKQAGKKVQLRHDWDDVKLPLMEDILRVKFSYWDLKAMLLFTGKAELIEGNWWGDRYWGVCKGTGENHLGKLLMKLRDEVILNTPNAYAGIGSRETPQEVLDTMARIAKVKAQKGWILRSGRARGADQAFEFGATYGLGKMEIILPKSPFEGAYVGGCYHLMTEKDEALAGHFLTKVIEPRHLHAINNNDFARRAHRRNVLQIMGLGFNRPVKQVFCYAREVNGVPQGGTATAIALAQVMDIPVYNLWHEKVHQGICKQLERFK
jgi:ribA/ribD-fused uncharacterized protein